MEKEFEYCLRCHRKLKNVESRKIGYGEICLAKHLYNKESKKRLFKLPVDKESSI